jgi:hypothetical protein
MLYKILGSLRIAAQLAASQEGLSSMKLVQIIYFRNKKISFSETLLIISINLFH